MRPGGRVALAISVAAAVFVAGQQPVLGQAAFGDQDSTTIGAGATSPGGNGTVNPVSFGGETTAAGTPVAGSAGSGGSTPSPYTYEREYISGPCPPIEGQPPGRLYRDLRTDTRTGETVEMAIGCERPVEPDPVPPPGGGPAPPPSAGALAVRALTRTPLPAPAIAMSPGGDVPLLVNLPTFLWIDPAQWHAVSASASAGAVTSTVTAVPERVVWDMGQGDSVTCQGPGAPYVPSLADDAQPSDCRFTYRASSARTEYKTFTVTATVEWHVTWVAVGAPGGGDLGYSRRSSTATVRVAELQALNTSSRS